jgi:hypothetical protein
VASEPKPVHETVDAGLFLESDDEDEDAAVVDEECRLYSKRNKTPLDEAADAIFAEGVTQSELVGGSQGGVRGEAQPEGPENMVGSICARRTACLVSVHLVRPLCPQALKAALGDVRWSDETRRDLPQPVEPHDWPDHQNRKINATNTIPPTES